MCHATFRTAPGTAAPAAPAPFARAPVEATVAAPSLADVAAALQEEITAAAAAKTAATAAAEQAARSSVAAKVEPGAAEKALSALRAKEVARGGSKVQRLPPPPPPEPAVLSAAEAVPLAGAIAEAALLGGGDGVLADAAPSTGLYRAEPCLTRRAVAGKGGAPATWPQRLLADATTPEDPSVGAHSDCSSSATLLGTAGACSVGFDAAAVRPNGATAAEREGRTAQVAVHLDEGPVAVRFPVGDDVTAEVLAQRYPAGSVCHLHGRLRVERRVADGVHHAACWVALRSGQELRLLRPA